MRLMRVAFQLLLLVAITSTALADPQLTDKLRKQKAREAYEAGERAFRLGDLNVAAERFKESYSHYPAPLLLFNLAQVHRQSGELEKAAFFFKQYLSATDPDNRDRAEAERRLNEVEKQLEERKRASQSPPVAPQPPVDATPKTATVERSSPQKSSQRPRLVAGGIALGVGLVGIAMGGAGAAVASSEASELTSAAKAMDVFDASKERRGKQMQSLSIAGFAIGGVGIVTGAALLGVALTKRER